MKKRKTRNIGFSIVGVISFFVLIAFVMQIAILVYDWIRRKTESAVQIAVLILVLILILAGFCTFIDYLRRKYTVQRPVEKILNATEKISKGDFSVRLPIVHEYGKYNQYDLIMENLNVMTAELEKNEMLKSDFISNVSHEIKTPLAVIQNYASLLASDCVSDTDRKKYAEILVGASKRITDLISNVLKLSKLENQEILEKKEKFSLTESLSNVVLGFETAIEKKNIELYCDFDDVSLVSSKSLLEIVWNNLISNAVKFTNDGGKIAISLKGNNDGVEVKVSDTGCGISSAAGERIFEKFYQGDTSHSGEGNGLGLALVKKVIDVLGGEISVQSQINKGSTFTILLKAE